MNSGDVILADEPTGALDSHNGDEEMMQLLQEESCTATVALIIIVTHTICMY